MSKRITKKRSSKDADDVVVVADNTKLKINAKEDNKVVKDNNNNKAAKKKQQPTKASSTPATSSKRTEDDISAKIVKPSLNESTKPQNKKKGKKAKNQETDDQLEDFIPLSSHEKKNSDINELQLDAVADKVREAVGALLKHRKVKSESNNILDDEDDFIFLGIGLNHIPIVKPSLKPVTIQLPHTISKPNTEICIFVKDQAEFKKTFEREGIKVSKVVGLAKLRTNYKAYETRHKLAKSYDLYLADSCILKFLPVLLGTPFFKKKKAPIAVDLTKGIKKQIDKALACTVLRRGLGPLSTIKAGRTDQKPAQVAANVVQIISTLISKSIMRWQDIQSLHVKTSTSVALPVYNALTPYDAPPKKETKPKVNIRAIMNEFIADNFDGSDSDDDEEGDEPTGDIENGGDSEAEEEPKPKKKKSKAAQPQKQIASNAASTPAKKPVKKEKKVAAPAPAAPAPAPAAEQEKTRSTPNNSEAKRTSERQKKRIRNVDEEGGGDAPTAATNKAPKPKSNGNKKVDSSSSPKKRKTEEALPERKNKEKESKSKSKSTPQVKKGVPSKKKL